MSIHKKKTGLPPGSIIYSGVDRGDIEVDIDLIEYSEAFFQEEKNAHFEKFSHCSKKDCVSWIKLSGVHQAHKVKEVSHALGIHDLTTEDILHTNQRPKVEVNEDYIFATLRDIAYNSEKRSFCFEQISLVLKNNMVVSFQETSKCRPLEDVYTRIAKAKGRIKKMGADYLLFAILDSTIDRYFLAIEHMQRELDELEDKSLNESEADIIQDINRLKKELIHLRRVIMPVKDMISLLIRDDSILVLQENKIYLRDASDHCLQVLEGLETMRDILHGLVDAYQAAQSNKMNEIMKYLTVFTSIFTPLTFIAGIYGMNFKHMPELEWEYGYYALWIFFLVIGITLYFIFRRKKWL